MINNNNENINKVRTDKWFSAFLVTCSASSIGAVTVTSGSASQTQNMTSANAAAFNKQMNIGQDTANASWSMPPVVADKLANSCKTLLSELQGSNDVQAISNYNENCAELTGALTL